MKRHESKLVLWIAIVVWMIGGAMALSAEEEEAPLFLVVWDEDVKPEQMETYMKTRIAEAKLWEQYGFDFPFMTFVQDFRVTTAYYLKAFAQLDGVPAKLEAKNQETGGKMKQLEKQRMACISESSTTIVAARPDLSYMPEEPVFTPDLEKPFYNFRIVYHIKPDKVEEAEAMGKKLKALNEKKQSPMGYLMYQKIFGQNDIGFVAVINAKDKAAFAAMDQQMEANPDPEIEALFKESAHLLTKIETQEGTFVPEASYIPD